jgi:hypothetical protein
LLSVGSIGAPTNIMDIPLIISQNPIRMRDIMDSMRRPPNMIYNIPKIIPRPPTPFLDIHSWVKKDITSEMMGKNLAKKPEAG